MPIFSVEHHRYGVIFDHFEVPSSTSPFVGIMWEGWDIQPDINVTASLAPYRIKAAIRRAGRWQEDKLCSDVLRLDMRDYRGRPMGTLIARLKPSQFATGATRAAIA